MAFHPYPQLIPQFFNIGGFGPPRGLTRASTWPWVDHSASGLGRATRDRPVRTRFRYGYPTRVNLATHRKLAGSFFKRHAVTTVAPKNNSDAPTACRHTVSGTISLRSRGTFHHSLTVLSAIGHQGIFRLSGWSRQIHTGFLGPRATWVSLKRAVNVSATWVLPSTPDLSHVLRLHQRFLTRLTAGRL